MPHQLDIFTDSRDTVLRNDLAAAVLAGRPAAVLLATQALQAEFPADPVLASAAVLTSHLQRQQLQETAAPPTSADLQAAVSALDGATAAAAAALLGQAQAAPWLATQWCALAARAGHIAWQPPHAGVHAAALYLRGQAWAQAADAVARIPSWRRIPQPLLWMAQARWQLQGADAGWPLLAEALWLAPARAAALLGALGDKRLDKQVASFEDRFDPAPADVAGAAAADAAQWAWLPAFALVEQPLLATPLATAKAPADTAPGQAFSTVMALLRLERQGRHHEIVTHRARLRGLCPPLFAAYMATR